MKTPVLETERLILRSVSAKYAEKDGFLMLGKKIANTHS